MAFLNRRAALRAGSWRIVPYVILVLGQPLTIAVPSPLPLLPSSRVLESVPFEDGEHVRYEVNWKALPILPAIKAGVVDFRVVLTQFEGISVYRITAEVHSAGILASMGVKVEDNFESIVEARTFRSLRFVHRIRTNRKQRDVQLDVDYETGHATIVEHSVEESPVVIREKMLENLPDRIADVVSVFYAGRLTDLKEQQTYFVNLYDNGEIKRVQVAVEGREKVRSLLDSHQAFRLRAGEGIFREGELLVWYERSDLKLPVRFEANVPLGKVFGQLALFESPRLTKARVKVAACRPHNGDESSPPPEVTTGGHDLPQSHSPSPAPHNKGDRPDLQSRRRWSDA